jgi:hypothetical protein
MRCILVALSLLLCPLASAQAQFGVNFGSPGVNIGINFTAYPDLVLVPGYPVYYAPRVNSNYFFYDGLYWVYENDYWYSSSWYNGPWQSVGPEYVPLYLLRVPVRYYRQPPPYFRGWASNAAPRWGDHWGRDWESRRGGWDRFDRNAIPKAAPLPAYQRQYSGNNYPRAAEQQYSIRTQNYRYAPREAVTQQHYQQQGGARGEPARQAPVQQRPQIQQQQAQPNPRQPQGQRPENRPQDRGGEREAAPQGRGEEHKGSPQERGGERKPEQQDRGRENRNEDRGPDRR